MRALVVTPRQRRSARVIEVDDPRPREGEALVRGVRLGLCGTDHELNEGLYGEAPPGSSCLILGHEALGRIERGAGEMRSGTHVVGMVRRPDECPNCLRGEADMCLWGTYRERGIHGLHGFGSEWWTEEPRYLVPIPEGLVDVAVLLEPISVVEKGLRQAYEAQRHRYWLPERCLVAGAGPIGILAALVARLRGLSVTVFERSAKAPRRALLARAGIAYAATSETPLDDIARSVGRIDLAIDATGSAGVPFALMDKLGANGALVLMSIPGGDDRAELPIARIARELVLGNRLVLGTVNAHRTDFERGVRDLGQLEERWPGTLASLITRRVPLRDAASAVPHDPAQIKVVVELE